MYCVYEHTSRTVTYDMLIIAVWYKLSCVLWITLSSSLILYEKTNKSLFPEYCHAILALHGYSILLIKHKRAWLHWNEIFFVSIWQSAYLLNKNEEPTIWYQFEFEFINTFHVIKGHPDVFIEKDTSAPATKTSFYFHVATTFIKYNHFIKA